MASVYDPEGVQLFAMFNVELPNGELLWHERPTVKTDKTDDFSAISRDQLIALQEQERQERVKKLAKVYDALGDLSDEEYERCGGLCDHIAPPKWI